MRFTLLAIVCFAVTADPATSPVAPNAAQHAGGYILGPNDGTTLMFCTAPGLSVTIKVDSVSAGTTGFAMGTAAIAPKSSNVGVHPDEDEINFFYGGSGSAVLGNDTVPIGAGSTMYVPRGVRHGFVNPGDRPLEFAWVVAPSGLANRFRARGRLPGQTCPP